MGVEYLSEYLDISAGATFIAFHYKAVQVRFLMCHCGCSLNSKAVPCEGTQEGALPSSHLILDETVGMD